MNVSVRERERNLSKCLERTAHGATSRVTDRGTPKAILGPLPERLHLDEGTANGWVEAPATPIAEKPARRGSDEPVTVDCPVSWRDPYGRCQFHWTDEVEWRRIALSLRAK